MKNLKFVFDYVVQLFQVTVSFPPFSFTIAQYFLALIALDIVILFLWKVFTDD